MYTEEQVAIATEKGKEKILARMFLARADKFRYGNMLSKLQNDYITGRHDVYPNSRVAAFALLNNWNGTYDRGFSIQFKGHNETSFVQNVAKTGGIACWGCGKEGTLLLQCENETCIKKFKAKQARKGKTFTKPNENGEQHFNVPSKGIKREEDFILDEYCGYDIGNEFHQTNNRMSFNDDYRKTRVGDTMILLDSQSTHSTFYVRRLVRNIREAPRPLKMVTNAGTIVYTKQADLPD
jgi:hypothetical protein